MSSIKSPENVKDLPLAIIKNMIVLSTSGFGVVVALAWNELIKQAVAEYIYPFFGKSSGIISLLIYAIVVTLLAIVITMQLSTVQKRLENLSERKLKSKNPEKSAKKS